MSRKIIDYKTPFGRFKQIARYYPEIIPVLSEGDSWFSYPLVGNNLMDHLVVKFGGAVNYFRLESSGHTALDMFSDCDSGQLEKLAELVEDFSVPLVLISAGGNDIVGEDLDFLLDAATQPDDVNTLLNSANLQTRFDDIKLSYQRMIDCLLAANTNIRILAHSYDYPVVSGQAAPVTINSIGLAAPLINFLGEIGPWMQPYLQSKGLTDAAAQQQFSDRLIDTFHDNVLIPLKQQNPCFDFVDMRGTLQKQLSLWNDEIHPTNDGFALLTEVFWSSLQPLLVNIFQNRQTNGN
ncbi:hypothetical protein [Marinicella sp. W31]|uniref:hypothetical protein n=1 Tax=Marinicella sp. W31 TaxID=3023713 RepID=UPI003757A135